MRPIGIEAGPALGADRARIDGAKRHAVLAVLAGERQREVLTGGVGSAGADFPIRRLYAVIAD
jgi:hypothetical protein